MQSCEIYFRGECLYVVSISFSEFGVGVSVGPMYKAGTDSPQALGSAAKAALDASKQGIPHPKNKAEMKVIQSNLYNFTKAKSWSDLAKNGKHINIERSNSVVTCTLSRLITGGGLEPTAVGFSCSSNDVTEIGSNILKLLGFL